MATRSARHERTERIEILLRPNPAANAQTHLCAVEIRVELVHEVRFNGLFFVSEKRIPADREHGLVRTSAVDGRPPKIDTRRNVDNLLLERGRVEIGWRESESAWVTSDDDENVKL